MVLIASCSNCHGSLGTRESSYSVTISVTRFDTWEDDSWLDPDRSGPPNSNLNRLYDDTDLVDDAEERLMAARAEHAEMGDNALDGSQLSEMLAGQGGAPTITAY
eukprot:COSAG03_NODE_6_length_26200_cov_62.015517_14_plen_105_part_00